MKKILLTVCSILLIIFAFVLTAAACDDGNGEPEGEASPSLAYDPNTNRFLMVYTKCTGSWDSGTHSDIYGKFLKHDGTAYGDEFAISSTPYDENYPLAAYDHINRKFLITWFDDRNDPDSTYDIYGQFVNSSGTLSGSTIDVSINPNDQLLDGIGFDAETQRFLIIWDDYRNDPASTDIYGQLVNAAGTLSGNNFVISDAANSQGNGALAYDSHNKRFLAVWGDDRGATNDIYGQFITGGGSLSGDNFIVSNAVGDKYVPTTAYDSINRRFLVTWQDSRNPCTGEGYCANFDIYGQIINADGSGIDTASDQNFVISSGLDESPLYSPRTTYDSTNQRYFVGWYGENSPSYNILGNYVSASGAVSVDDIRLTDDGQSHYGPAVAYNSYCKNFMTASWSNWSGNGVITVSPLGECAASAPTAPVLVSPADGATGLDTTVTFAWDGSTDADGDTVTYKISYCTNQDFTTCDPVNVSSLDRRQQLYAGVGNFPGLFLMGMVFIGGLKYRRNMALLLAVCLTATLIFVSCSGSGGSSSSTAASSGNQPSHTVSDLNSNTTYYWKVTADDGKGGISDSATRSFTTR